MTRAKVSLSFAVILLVGSLFTAGCSGKSADAGTVLTHIAQVYILLWTGQMDLLHMCQKVL